MHIRPRDSATRIWALAVTLVALVAGCTSAPARFALRPPLWQDADMQHVGAEPKIHVSGLYADALDQTFLRPTADFFAFRAPNEAQNVNAFDEVPDSSWFTNRLGRHDLDAATVAAGACAEGPALRAEDGPWTVVAAKTEGVTPGFFIKAADGQRYLLKVDGPLRPERASAADTIGSRLYHAVGYHAPCNTVVFFSRDDLTIAPDAVAADDVGDERPLVTEDVDYVLDRAVQLPDGRLRASASRFLPGRPLGPFRWEGTRPDDPNDVVPHEERREVRALRLMAAWLGHFDIREQNSLDMLVEEEGRRFIRHYQIDFGDSFGSPWADDRLNRRIGHSYYFDAQQVLVDLVSFGGVSRPWHRSWDGSNAGIFLYYGTRDFAPADWRAIYPNPAFSRMTELDGLWLSRILARLTDAHLRAVVAEGRLSDPRSERYLLTTLTARRDAIIEYYLGRLVPIDGIEIADRSATADGPQLCFDDLAIRHTAVTPDRVRYRVRVMGGANLDQRLGWALFRPDPERADRTCVTLPLGAARPSARVPVGSPPDYPGRYAVIEVYVQRDAALTATRLSVHVYDQGPREGFTIVGIVRDAEPVHLTSAFPEKG